MTTFRGNFGAAVRVRTGEAVGGARCEVTMRVCSFKDNMEISHRAVTRPTWSRVQEGGGAEGHRGGIPSSPNLENGSSQAQLTKALEGESYRPWFLTPDLPLICLESASENSSEQHLADDPVPSRLICINILDGHATALLKEELLPTGAR